MKKTVLILMTIAMMMVVSLTALAGTWKQDAVGWWYENDDGSYAKSAWQNIGGLEYYFNENGYLLVNTVTPDGFQVNADGVKVGTASVPAQASQQAAPASTSTGEYWLSATGSKYHKIPNCGKMNPNKAIKVTLEEAKKNHTACDKCF